MKCNVGNVDRWIRIVLGIAIAVLGIIFSCWCGLVGVVLLATGIFKRCLLYYPFKISTSKEEPKA